MSYIAGIDVDTKAIHIVFVDENGTSRPWYMRRELFGHDAWERTRAVRHVMPGSSIWGNVVAVGLENPAGRAGTGLYAVMRTTGAVLACLPAQLLVQPWRPGEWRKTVGLKGNATKAQVAMHALATMWDDGCPQLQKDWPQDACDAYCIALATRAVLRTGQAKVA